MSYNRSVFPEGGFDYENTADLLDLPPSQAQNASLYQQLKAKQNRTPDEDTQLINLIIQLQNYLITPEEINHMRNCITASQKFTYSTFVNYFKFKNNWTSNPSEPYRIFNTVRYTDGCTYMALVDFPNNPPTDNTQWLKNSAKGDKGDKGLNPRGNYDNNTDYIIDDLVYFDNSTFRNINTCKGILPTNTGYWQPFALKGSDGANLVIKGDYDNTISYVVNDLVKFNGFWYYAIQNTTGHVPTNTLYWKLFLAPAGTNASDIQITDIENIYNSTNVEDALYEVKSEADSTKNKVGNATLQTTAQDLSGAVNENSNKIGNLSTQELESTGYGIINGLTVSAQSTPNMTLNVANGIVHMPNGVRLVSMGNSALAITTADVINPRIDIVYVNSDSTIGYTAGTPTVTPTAPATPNGTFLLSQINVGANITTITSGNIIDKRKIKVTLDSHNADNTKHVAKDGTLQTGLNSEKVNGKTATAIPVTNEKTDLIGMVNEAFTNANNGKTSVANAIGSPSTATETFAQLTNDIQTQKNNLATNLTNKGQSASGTDTLANLVAKVANVNTGRRYASGTTASSTDTTSFTMVNGGVMSGNCYLQVTGLAFKPSVIIIKYYVGGVEYYTLYDEITSNLYTKTIKQSAYNNNGYYVQNNNYKGDAANAIINVGSFKVPVIHSNVLQTWLAIE